MKVYVYLNQSGYIDLTAEPKCDNMYLEKFLGTFEMPVEPEKKTVSIGVEFNKFPKIARLSREVIVTEKIDGTNAQIYIGESGEFLIGSRTQWITPEKDNHGFARWAMDNKNELLNLGVGLHFGEWWGSGIQRGYGLPKGEKRFSLFNTLRWADERDIEKYPIDRPSCCHVVPVIRRGIFNHIDFDFEISNLSAKGSLAVPGFMNPEGIVVYHVAGNVAFKKTILNDEKHKGEEQ